jgi:hypothetical protein
MTPLRLPKYFDIIVLFLMIAFLKGVAQFLPFSMAKKRSPPSTRALLHFQARRSFYEGD